MRDQVARLLRKMGFLNNRGSKEPTEVDGELETPAQPEVDVTAKTEPQLRAVPTPSLGPVHNPPRLADGRGNNKSEVPVAAE